jgi:predicted nucleotidyltransferase
MRLSEAEKSAILSVITALDPEAEIILFGSRADDAKRGGDIDLAVVSRKIRPEDKTGIRLKLYDLLGERKIDIVLAENDGPPIVRLARKMGVLLHGR